MLSDEEKNSMELDIEAKYVGRTEKEFLNNITYAECLYILDTKNKYCDDIKNLSLIKIVDIVNEQFKEIEEYKKQLDLDYVDKHFVPIERYNQLEKEIEELKQDRDEYKEEYIKLQNARYYNYISKDKIKAKIEEIKKSKENIYFEEHLESILQSLLEKE